MSSEAVAAILEDIQALTGDELDDLFRLLDAGMWDEWDTSLIGGLEIGLGGEEIRLAAKSAAIAAKHTD